MHHLKSLSSLLLFFIFLNVTNTLASNSSDIIELNSETEALKLINMPHSGGFVPTLYRVKVSDINFDGFPDFRIELWNRTIESPIELPHATDFTSDTIPIHSDRSSTVDALDELIQSRALGNQPELSQRLPDGTTDSQSNNRSYVLELASLSKSQYSLTTLSDASPDPCSNNRCILSTTSTWRNIFSRIYWADINGDKQTDLLIHPFDLSRIERSPDLLNRPLEDVSTDVEYPSTPDEIDYFTSPLPSIAIVSGQFKYDTHARYGYAKSPPSVTDVLHDERFGKPLNSFKYVKLVDANNDGRADLWASDNANYTPKLVGIADSNGVFTMLNSTSSHHPSENPDCTIPINVPENANGYYTNNDCNKVFVLPPTKGKTALTQLNTTPNISMCAQVKTIIDEQNTAIETISALNQQLIDLVLAMNSGDTYNELKASHTSAFEELNYIKEPAKTQATTLLKNAKTLLDMAEVDYEIGVISEDELNHYKAAHLIAIANLEQATYEYLVAVEYESITEQALIEYVASNIEMQSQVTKLINDLINLNEMRRQLVNETLSMSGGIMQFSFTSEWSKSVSNYAATNVQPMGLSFQKLPLTSARIISGLSEQSAKLNGILWTKLIDIKNEENFRGDDLYGPAAPAIHLTNVLTHFFDEQIPTLSQDTYHAESGLNLFALCPHFPDGETGNSDSLQQIPALLALNLKQNFQVVSNAGYRVTFNLGHLAAEIFNYLQQIDDPKGSFLRGLLKHSETLKLKHPYLHQSVTVSYPELESYINSLQDTDWFNVRFIDNGVLLSDQENVRTSIKERLIRRVLSNISYQSNRVPLSCDLNNQKICVKPQYVLLSLLRLQSFIEKNSRWQFSERTQFHFKDKTTYTDYRPATYF